MNADFIDALNQLCKEKGISKETIHSALEAALISAYKRNFNSEGNVRVNVDENTGEIKVFARKTVVDNVNAPQLELSLDYARELNSGYAIGDIVEVEVTPTDFGRIAAQTAKQVTTQRIREAERGMIYSDYIEKEGALITGIIRRADHHNYYLDLGKVEAALPFSEIIPGERFKQKDRVKAYVLKVENSSKGPQVFVSRAHAGFLKGLFELEVPEIASGLVEVKSITREAGYRSKIAVYSHNSDVDPVGACVGQKGSRVQVVVGELRGEKIDIVKWSENMGELIANSLSPSKVLSVDIDADQKIAHVIVPDNQLSLAIGKEGQNARLAARLTNWKIDIRSESQGALV